jgi:hypothetical protein
MRVLVANHFGPDEEVSRVPGVHPGPSSSPMRVDPGETRTVEALYTAQYRPENPFALHYQDTVLWAGGRIVDQRRTPYYVIPTSALSGVLGPGPVTAGVPETATTDDPDETPVRSAAFAYSTTTTSNVTAADWATYLGNATQVVETELSPTDPNATVTYDLDGDPHNVTFLLSTETGSSVDLNVYDAAGRHVGPDPRTGTDEVQIPGATYTGNQSNPERVTVTDPRNVSATFRLTADAARFTTNESVSVQVFAITEPTRPPILGVTPASIQLTGSPHAGDATNVTITEVGGQRNLSGVTLSPSDLTTDGGAPLPASADISFETTSFDLSRGGDRVIRTTLETTALDGVSTTQTRYNGTVSIGSAETQPLTANLSVLLLDTADETLRLVDGNRQVDGVHVTNTTGDASLPAGLPTNVTVERSYRTTILGTGNVSIRTESIEGPAGARAFGYTGDRWIELTTSVQAGGITTEIPADVERFVVAKPMVSVTLDLVAGPGGQVVTPTATSVNRPTTIRLTQEAYGAVVHNVSAATAATPNTTIPAARRSASRWTLQTRFGNNTYNATTGTYETVRVTATAEGRARTVTKNLSVEVRGEGDVNGDGRVDIFDAVVVGRSWEANTSDPAYTYAADLNGDGRIDIFDAVAIGRNWRDGVE